jgi:hypothetical protein
LLKLLTERPCFTPDLSRIVAPDSLLSTFDVDTMPPEALLFQSGYLSIASARHLPGRLQLTLKYPNQEVQASLNELLLQQFTGNAVAASAQVVDLYDRLLALDWVGLQALFHAFFVSIPHQWYTNSPLAQYEGYYASIFYSHFAALGLDIRLEDTTNHGRIDMTVLFAGQVFIFEFKVIELAPEGAALAQIKDRGYADKYQGRGEPMHLIGVEFSRVNRNIAGFEVLSL